MASPRTRVVGPAQIALLWAASLGVYLLVRLALLSAYGLPVASPGLLALIAVLVAASWALSKSPFGRQRGRRGPEDLGGRGLAPGRRSLIYYFVEGKDRMTPLAFACFAGGGLCLLDQRLSLALGADGPGHPLCLSGALDLVAAGLGMDLVAGPIAGRAAPLLPGPWPCRCCWACCSWPTTAIFDSRAPRRPELASRSFAAAARAAGRCSAALAQLGALPDGIWYDEVNLSRATEDRVMGTDGGAPPTSPNRSRMRGLTSGSARRPITSSASASRPTAF